MRFGSSASCVRARNSTRLQSALSPDEESLAARPGERGRLVGLHSSLAPPRQPPPQPQQPPPQRAPRWARQWPPPRRRLCSRSATPFFSGTCERERSNRDSALNWLAEQTCTHPTTTSWAEGSTLAVKVRKSAEVHRFDQDSTAILLTQAAAVGSNEHACCNVIRCV